MSFEKDYKENAQGALVPVSKIKVIDMMRDELVCKVAQSFKEKRDELTELKDNIMSEIYAFIEQSASQFDTKIGGKKGNVTLTSYDGKLKIQIHISEYISFDERLQVAKALIDECIHAWAAGANDNIMALVNDAFQVDKEGKVSTARILGLRRLNIEDAKWQQAMTAIADSMQTIGSKTYIRVYARENQDAEFKQISLDFAKLEVA